MALSAARTSWKQPRSITAVSYPARRQPLGGPVEEDEEDEEEEDEEEDGEEKDGEEKDEEEDEPEGACTRQVFGWRKRTASDSSASGEEDEDEDEGRGRRAGRWRKTSKLPPWRAMSSRRGATRAAWRCSLCLASSSGAEESPPATHTPRCSAERFRNGRRVVIAFVVVDDDLDDASNNDDDNDDEPSE